MTFLRPFISNRLTKSLAPAVRDPSRSLRRVEQPTPAQHGVAIRFFTSTDSLRKKIDLPQKHDEAVAKDELANGQQQANRKGPRKTAGKTSSLRSVAVEAQRSRAFVKSRGRTRFVDPDAETKVVTAYCAAETYSISSAARLVKAQGYELDPLQTGLYPQVIHVQTSDRPSEVKDYQQGDIFIFPSGTVVTWNVREREALKLVNQVLPAAAEGSHLDLLETEDLDYLEDPSKETSEVVGDTIVLGTKAEQESPDAQHDSKTNENDQRHEVDTILAKIAFSSGLARSTKLAVLETLLSNYQHSTREIPTMLASNKTSALQSRHKLFTRSFILRKTGELLSIRAQLNLYSELTDSMPDIFWDSRHELGLGEYYDQVGRALDVGVRIKVLNEKIGFAQEIASVLREQLSEKHGLRLEWAIIALIAVEVVLEFYRHYTERKERDDPASTEALFRKYLLGLAKEEKA
ncbi:Nn.00g051340.m01.CDS01 [Neocucurbitaria sp. VM-36]